MIQQVLVLCGNLISSRTATTCCDNSSAVDGAVAPSIYVAAKAPTFRLATRFGGAPCRVKCAEWCSHRQAISPRIRLRRTAPLRRKIRARTSSTA
jgi:hypothetical protein